MSVSFCSANLAVGIAVWCRALLPQILGQTLPTINATQKSAAVHALPAAGLDVALGYGEGIFVEAEPAGITLKTRALGPSSGDSKRLFAVKLTESELLETAAEGLQVQVCPREA